MTEPNEIAAGVEQVADGVWHWRIHNSSIGGAISSSHAVATDDGCVLIDPVRLAGEALASLPAPTAILLNAKTHQRAAWRYRRELGVEVWLPGTRPPPTRSPTGATPRATSCREACARSELRARSGPTTRSCSSARPVCCSAPT